MPAPSATYIGNIKLSWLPRCGLRFENPIARNQPLSQRRKSLRQQQSVQAAIQQAAASRDDQLSQLAQRVAQLERQVGVSQLQQEFADAERRWQQERRRLLDELERTGELLKLAQAELEGDRQEPAQPLDQLQEQPDPLSADEEQVFARLRAMSLLKESSDAPKKDPIVPSQYDLAGSVGQPSRRKTDLAADSDEPHEQEISIDDYMVRLLDRARGAQAEVRQATERLSERPPVRHAPVKMEPRAKAPEASIGLAVMREIANQSARAAISTHHVRHHESRARRMKDFSMVAAALAAVLLSFADAFGSPLFIGGLVAALLSVGSFVRTVIRNRRSRRLSTQQPEPLDELDEAALGPLVGDQDSEADMQAIEQPEACLSVAETATP